MKTKSKLAMAASIFGIAALGLGTGAVAWFQVASAANAQFEGTIIGLDDGLQVGFMFNRGAEDAEELEHTADLVTGKSFGLSTDDSSHAITGKVIYWSTSTQVMPKTITAVIESGKYSTELNTVTSGSREAESTDGLSLYKAPVFNNNTLLVQPIADDADKADYSHYDMVFRTKNGSGVAISKNIGFEIAPTFTASAAQSDVTKALRLAFTVGSTTTVYNPSVTEDGTTAVGGRCDLDNDGYYDYKTFNAGGEIINREVAYGEFDYNYTDDDDQPAKRDATHTDLTHTDFKWGDASTTDSSITGTASFLNAKTKAYVLPLVQSTTAGVSPKTAGYKKLPAAGGTDVADTIVTTSATDGATKGFATLGVDMYIEGWDPACGNQIASAKVATVLSYHLL